MSISEIVLENFIIKIVLSLLIVHTIVYCDKSSNEVFQFPEFAYKETTKNVSEFLHLLIFPNCVCIPNLYSMRGELTWNNKIFFNFRSLAIANSSQLVSRAAAVNYLWWVYWEHDAFGNAYRLAAIRTFTNSMRLESRFTLPESFLLNFKIFAYSWKTEKLTCDWFRSKDVSYNDRDGREIKTNI